MGTRMMTAPAAPQPYRFHIVGDFPGPVVCGTADCSGCGDCSREGRQVDATNDVRAALAIVDELRRKGYRRVYISESPESRNLR